MTMMDSPVIREQLPTWTAEELRIEEEARDAAIQTLLKYGFVGAANHLATDYWGYGMEDTDDLAELRQINDDTLRAADYIELKEARGG